MRAGFVVVVLSTTLAMTATATSADTLRSARDQPLEEVAHTVDVRITDGVATYVVQRQFKNSGKTADEARLQIDLPDGATATGLRIRAKDRWHDGELLDRELAAQRYQELTGRGVYDPKDPALLWWLSSSELMLQVFPIMPGATSTVEYTLTAPPSYAHGSYELSYPRAIPPPPDGKPVATPKLTVRGAAMIDGIAVAAGTPTLLASGSTTRVAITVAPPAIPTWTARLGRVVASNAHVFTRLEVDTAPQLSALPKRAQVVFVLDTSYSIGTARIAAELAMAKAYATHVPDAELEIVVYQRAARRVFGTFVAARDFARAVDDATRRGDFVLGNGSAIDAGAKLAVAALASRPGPRRIVIGTDTLVRTSLDDAAALAPLDVLPPADVVHVVMPIAGALATELTRDDSAMLSPLATSHHGIFATLAIATATDVAPAVLELVRPTRIAHLAVSDTHLATDIETLVEGEGFRKLFEGTRTAAPERVTLTGQLWSDNIRFDVAATSAFSKATAAYIFGADDFGGLSEPEMAVVAKLGRAVSPVTSYLAIEPGVRPSKLGLPAPGSGWGTIGTGRYGTIGRDGGTGSTRVAPDLAALVDPRRCVATHKPGTAWTVALDVETTHDEIVDVELPGTTTTSPFAACLVEAVWNIRLDKRFDLEREHFSIVLAP